MQISAVRACFQYLRRIYSPHHRKFVSTVLSLTATCLISHKFATLLLPLSFVLFPFGMYFQLIFSACSTLLQMSRYTRNIHLNNINMGPYLHIYSPYISLVISLLGGFVARCVCVSVSASARCEVRVCVCGCVKASDLEKHDSTSYSMN